MEEQDRKLYPFKFVDKEVRTSWGEVVYKLADLGFVDSMVSEGWFGGNTLSEMMGTYMERVVGDDSFEYYGLQFPLMVKVIKTSSWQPFQVNAGDKEAEERYDSYGKKAFWYILESAGDAGMVLGLNRDIPAGEFYSRCLDGSVKEVLNVIHPQAGDSFVIEPGTVFAAGPGLTILEIGECSELTFNLHNWGVDLPDSEELLLEEAFDLINFAKTPPAALTPRSTSAGGNRDILADCEEFTVTRMDLKDPLRVYSEQAGDFAVYHCLSGEAVIQPGPESFDFSPVTLRAGQTVLVPSEVNDFLLLPSKAGTTLFEALAPRRLSADSYTGSAGEPETPDPHVRNWN